MTPRLIIERPGLGVAVQDLGRKGFRRFGAPQGGALDSDLLEAANRLAGAPAGAAGLEILLAAPALRVEGGPARIGLAGEIEGIFTGADGSQDRVEGWRGLLLREGERLDLRLRRGPAYAGFSGGLDIAPLLGGRSTLLRAKFGGWRGRALEKGDALACGAAEGGALFAAPFARETGPIRFLPGPQADRFEAGALAAFTGTRWRVGADSDRMGMRLAGPALRHLPGGANIVTDGVTPGAIQVPADGQPIVLRADCQTSGGYAKIGCVISADIGRLAHVQPGDEIVFAAVSLDQAARARGAARERFARWRESVTPEDREWDSAKLWSENLVSGATSGD